MTSKLIKLAQLTITAAETQVGTSYSGFAGLSSLLLQAKFFYGSGGTGCKVYVQTAIDPEETWVDVACWAFALANAVGIMNLSAGDGIATPYAPLDGALADNTRQSGIIGEYWRVKVISTGVYAGQTNVGVWLLGK